MPPRILRFEEREGCPLNGEGIERDDLRNRADEPALSIAPGETIELQTVGSSGGTIESEILG